MTNFRIVHGPGGFFSPQAIHGCAGRNKGPIGKAHQDQAELLELLPSQVGPR